MSEPLTPAQLVAHNLRRLRGDRTQEWLAGQLQVSRPTVVAMEKGNAPVTVERLVLAMRAFDCGFADLVWPLTDSGYTAVEVVKGESMDPLTFMDLVTQPPAVAGGDAAGIGPRRPQLGADDLEWMTGRIRELQEHLEVKRGLMMEESDDA